MRSNNLSFRQFLELDAPHADTHFDALKRHFGIDPEDVADIPQISSFMNLGKGMGTLNRIPYEIMDYKYNEKGEPVMARIKLIHNAVADPSVSRWTKKGEKYVKHPNDPGETDDIDGKEFWIKVKPKNEKEPGLEKAITQGLDQAGGGAAGGMPPPMGGAPPMGAPPM